MAEVGSFDTDKLGWLTSHWRASHTDVLELGVSRKICVGLSGVLSSMDAPPPDCKWLFGDLQRV